MSELVEHARRELELLGEDPALSQNLLAVVGAFASFGHSGSSAEVAADHLERLLRFRPLTPITSDPAEWVAVEGFPVATWQNIRDSRQFSIDAGQTWKML